MFPDLRYAGAINSAEAFKAIVIDGALTANGMVSFAKALTAGRAGSDSRVPGVEGDRGEERAAGGCGGRPLPRPATTPTDGERFGIGGERLGPPSFVANVGKTRSV